MEKINELESGENAGYWVWTYRKIPKISPGAYIFLKALFKGLIFGGAYIRRGLSTEENLRFKTDWASLIVGRKLTVFALFYFAFEGNFQVQAPRGAYIWRCDLTEGFFALRVWGACTWRDLFSEFHGIRELKQRRRLRQQDRHDMFFITYFFHSPPSLINHVSFNPLSPNGVQHQFSPNHIHWLSRDLVMRINKLIT